MTGLLHYVRNDACAQKWSLREAQRRGSPEVGNGTCLPLHQTCDNFNNSTTFGEVTAMAVNRPNFLHIDWILGQLASFKKKKLTNFTVSLLPVPEEGETDKDGVQVKGYCKVFCPVVNIDGNA